MVFIVAIIALARVGSGVAMAQENEFICPFSASVSLVEVRIYRNMHEALRVQALRVYDMMSVGEKSKTIY